MVELEELDAPPDAVDGVLGVAALEELDELSFLVVSTDADPETDDELPDGVLGVVVEPDEEEVDEPGAVRVTVRSPSLSQPANSPAPSARDTATARIECFISRPPWLG